MPEIVFANESYKSRSGQLSSQRCVNAFVEREPGGTKGQTPLFGAPGLTTFTTLPAGPLRGMWNFRGRLYAVAGQELYRINSAGGFLAMSRGVGSVKIGAATSIPGTGPVSMSDNGSQLMIVNGVGGYLLNQFEGFEQIEDPNFYSAATVQYFDDYFVFDRRRTNEFFLSGIGDGTSYNGLDFASAEAQPGFLTAVTENLELLFLLCQNHIEMWYDAGAADFPFQRYAGGVIERGCISPYAIAKQDDAIFFLGKDGIFYRLQGNVPIRVSTHAIETAIQKFGAIETAFCFTYTLEGHKMVHLTFPDATPQPDVSSSLAFDISTGMWHERLSVDAQGNSLGRWRGNCACEIYDKILIGDAYTGTIWQLDWQNFTEGGLTLPMLVHSAPIHSDKLRVFIHRLELDMEVGVGTVSGQGQRPKLMLRYSKDGGKTWSKIQPIRSIGDLGEFKKRIRYISLGQAYTWVFEILITDPVQRVLIATHLDAETGMP